MSQGDDWAGAWSDTDSADREMWLPPPSDEWQRAHGWKNGKPPPNGHASEQQSTDARQPGRILTGADFIGRHVPPVWLIDGIVQRSRLYACTSLTGHGKTAVWLFNACMIHAGRMIGQLNVFRGNDRIGHRFELAEAKRIEHEAGLILDPLMHCTGPVTVGNGGEMAIGTKAMQSFVDTVRERPDMLAIDASQHRMELADKADVLTLAVDAAMTIQAANSLEKMLVHQMTAAHSLALKAHAEALDLLKAYKRSGHVHQQLSIEAGRMMNASARMMETYQHGMLTLAKIRSGGQQTVVVTHVNVGDGGQAMVAGQVKLRGKRRRTKQAKVEG